jgi:predicted Zn-dependent protease
MSKDVFDKLLASAPTNPEIIYWAFQSEMDRRHYGRAREILVKGMEGANGSNPLLLVAMGQLELREKKTNDARQRFETAISLTKAKNIDILVAIGKANIDGRSIQKASRWRRCGFFLRKCFTA